MTYDELPQKENAHKPFTTHIKRITRRQER